MVEILRFAQDDICEFMCIRMTALRTMITRQVIVVGDRLGRRSPHKSGSVLTPKATALLLTTALALNRASYRCATTTAGIKASATLKNKSGFRANQ
jgi:hypothetical protein